MSFESPTTSLVPLYEPAFLSSSRCSSPPKISPASTLGNNMQLNNGNYQIHQETDSSKISRHAKFWMQKSKSKRNKLAQSLVLYPDSASSKKNSSPSMANHRTPSCRRKGMNGLARQRNLCCVEVIARLSAAIDGPIERLLITHQPRAYLCHVQTSPVGTQVRTNATVL